MVFVMKHNIKYSFYILSATFLFAFLLTMNSPLMSQPQSLVYATSQKEQEADQQEVLQISSDPQESKTNTGSIKSEQTEGSGKDENNDEDSIKSEVGCSAVATNDPNYVYCNTQQPVQPRQQTSQQLPQQNTPSNPSQNTLPAPTIDSDSSLTNNIPNSETTTTTTQKSFNTAGQFKPGSGQTESNIPLLSNDFSKSFAPGAGNAQVEGIGLAYLTVYPNFTYTGPVEICVFTSHPYEVKANPYCVEPYSDGTFHALQAPGLVGIRVSGNADPVDTSNCEFRIYPKQSKSCILNNLDSPFIKSKSETGAQDRVRAPIE
jgi:hypothetical protein